MRFPDLLSKRLKICLECFHFASFETRAALTAFISGSMIPIPLSFIARISMCRLVRSRLPQMKK